MRSNGRGTEAARMFCDIMNLLLTSTRFSSYVKRILNAAKLAYMDTIQNDVKESICDSDNDGNIVVAVDGT
ncbi:hypothetical protein TNIN_484211 [Trichonephila inaurata madagascariensis]|uniref:Uncharacterized protein n=1 Tax=Trichonephila inaurata madagascariensis TaxID=2747483 RepID=A0A8X6KK12_9ARAC|nr:hypothetical protein TNIN_484211 [Trichonephila inaurata madagascariensis]